MVCEDVESLVFHRITETLDGTVDCKKLPVKSAVPRFCKSELGKEGHRFPAITDVLLEDSTDTNARGEGGDSGEGFLGRGKGSCSFWGSVEGDRLASLARLEH